MESVEALFSLLESKEAYMPTRGQEGRREPTGQKKDTRTEWDRKSNLSTQSLESTSVVALN